MARRTKSKGKYSPVLTVILFACLAVYYVLTGGESDNIDIANNNYATSEVINTTSNTNVSSDLEIYYFDVGQADCIFAKNENECMLIDAGNNADGKLIVKELKSLGIQKIDYLIGTHPHEDHIGGMDDIINNFDIDEFYMPNKITTAKTFEDMLSRIKNENINKIAKYISTDRETGKRKMIDHSQYDYS